MSRSPSKSFRRIPTNKRQAGVHENRSRSVESKVTENNEQASSSVGLANEYKPPLFRDKRVDEPLAKEWFNGLRSDLHENQTDAFVYEYKSKTNNQKLNRDREIRRNKQYYDAKEKNKVDVKKINSQWMNSLRNDDDDAEYNGGSNDQRFNGGFEFGNEDTIGKSNKSKISVKEMIKVKEDRKKMEKQISDQWLNSLRSDLNENPHTWVALPSIKSKVGKTKSNVS